MMSMVNVYECWRQGVFLLSRDVIKAYFNVDKINELLNKKSDINEELFFIFKKFFSDFHLLALYHRNLRRHLSCFI